MSLERQANAADVQTRIRVFYEGRAVTVGMDGCPGLGFWRVESDRRIYRSPVRIHGNETPDFFQGLVQFAVEQHGV
jgi:hypothetical protein